MNKYLTGTAIALACAGLGGLLAGFAPGPEPHVLEWAGRLSTNFEDSRLPLVRRVRTAPHMERVSLALAPVESVAGFLPSDEGVPSSLLYLEGWTVGILTQDGPASAAVPPGTLGAVMPYLPPGAFRDADGGMATALSVAALAGEGEALSVDGRPLRWTARGPICFRPAVLPRPVAELPEPVLPEQGFLPRSITARAARYQESVERYSRKYGLDPSLVYAIMQTESGFNPSLISTRDAHGLMQVVPSTAGDEVHRWFGRSGLPTPAELLNPDNNIRYGTAYLHLLRTRHLEGVLDPVSREYCVIAAYNGGSGAVLRHFGPSREEAFAAINAMTPPQVLARLTENFPARETRFFVRKVLASRGRFVAAGKGEASSAGPGRAGTPPLSLAASRVPGEQETDPAGSETPKPATRQAVEREQRARLDSMRRWATGEGPKPRG